MFWRHAVLICTFASMAFAQRAIAQSAVTAPPCSLKNIPPDWQKAIGCDLLNSQQKAVLEQLLGHLRAEWMAEAMKVKPPGGVPLVAAPQAITLGKHWIASLREGLTLEDGTVWRITPYGKSGELKLRDEVTLQRSDSPSYEYMISSSYVKCYLIPVKSTR